MFKIFLTIILIIFLSILQLGFISALPYPLNSLDLILSLFIFVAILMNYRLGLWIAFGSGIFLDIYSPLFFGTISLSYLLSLVIIKYIFDHLFTNRSIYSLVVLTGAGTLVYSLLIFFFNFSLLLNFMDNNFGKLVLWQIILNIIFSVILFNFINFSTKKFKSVFLITR